MSVHKDISPPELIKDRGSLHPINHMKDSIMNLLASFGFEIIDGPEIETEKFNFDMLNTLASSIKKYRKQNINFVIVTSGAVQSGANELNLSERPKNLKELQADLDKLIQSESKLIKKDLVRQGVLMLSASNKNNEEVYKSLVKLSREFSLTGEDSIITNKLVTKFNVLRSLEKGMKSPVFNNYENFNGERTSLSDLKGKYVYIDVWATWCGPVSYTHLTLPTILLV